MTKPLVSMPRSCGGRQLSASESQLGAWIRREFEPARLAQTLDAAGELLPERHLQGTLSGPLLELLNREGKGFRLRLTELSYQLGGGGERELPPELLLIVEALHAGSLIVDDIQDGSQQRRGRPSLHALWGVPLALNAGNWLYFLPGRLLEELDAPPAVELELRRAIDRAALRCHYGQALDLGVRLGSLAQSEVRRVVTLSTRLKTASLLELSAELGSIAGRAPARLRRALVLFARRYGVALQMLDDVSGLYHPHRAQKGLEDLRNGCPTWPWAWLADTLDQVSYSRLSHQLLAVGRGELPPEVLAAALKKQLGQAPTARVRRELELALAELEAEVDAPEALRALRDEIERLGAAYV